MATLKQIRLELARTSDYPEGSSAHGYQLVAPLDGEGHLDVDVWRENRAQCTVQRFWAGEDDASGHLIHTRHQVWAFSYKPGEDDDEPIFRLEKHVFEQGEYISITEHDGVTRPFRIVSVI